MTNRLAKEWQQRLQLYAEGAKLRAKGNNFYIKGNKLREREKGNVPCVPGVPCVPWSKPILQAYAEGDKLCAEGYKLKMKGYKLWAKAIFQAYGNIELEWENWNGAFYSFECHLHPENGEIEIYGFKGE